MGSYFRQVILIYCLQLFTVGLNGQCLNHVKHLSGVEQIGCTEVTVTSVGDADSFTGCNIGPYRIGHFAEGSYTFSFSPPVIGVTIDIDGFDNHEYDGYGHEEVTIKINGLPYAIPDAGVPSNCSFLHAFVTPPGNLMCDTAPGGGYGACDDVQIDQTISSITVSDIFFVHVQAGVVFSLHFCCGPCLLDAGILDSAPLSLCPENKADIPPATFTYLEPDALLQYILFSDLNDTLGSIIATSNNPSFAFNPAIMQTGTTYYMASIIGENLNGNVDLSSYCLDLSNAVPVIWWPQPTVAFSVNHPNLCKGDCTLVTTTFTGTPPFSLTYSNTFTGLETKIFQDNIGSFEICAPLDSPSGNLVIQAIELTDANCSCN